MPMRDRQEVVYAAALLVVIRGLSRPARHPARAVHEGRIENGKLVAEWGVTDTLAVWQQLGLVPANS